MKEVKKLVYERNLVLEEREGEYPDGKSIEAGFNFPSAWLGKFGTVLFEDINQNNCKIRMLMEVHCADISPFISTISWFEVLDKERQFYTTILRLRFNHNLAKPHLYNQTEIKPLYNCLESLDTSITSSVKVDSSY